MADKIASLIQRRYQKCSELFEDIEDHIEINRNLYRGVLNVDDSYEWDYSLVDPQVFPIVRNYLSRSNPSKTVVRLDARRAEDVEKRKINQEFVNWELGEILLTSLFYRIFFSAYLTPRGYCKTGWKYEPAVKIQVKDEMGNMVEEKIMKEVTNRADAKFVRFNNLLIPNRNLPLLSEQPYVIELIQMRVGEMLDENERLEELGDKPYWDKKFIKRLRDSGVTSKLLNYEVDKATDADAKDELAFRSAYVPLMCMQTLENDLYYMPIEEDEEIINKDRTGKYWHGHYPYIDLCIFPEDDEYFNAALVDIVGDLQIAATEVLNQTLTNIRNINNDMWIAGTAATQTPDWMFQKRPSGIIRVVGDPTQIQPVRQQDNTTAALRVSQDLMNKSERASGISSMYSSGVSNQNINQTARGAQIIDQNIDTNMQMILDLFGEQIVKPLGEHFVELNAQYVKDDQIFYVTGRKNARDFMTMPKEMVSANFDVTVNSNQLKKQTPASRQASLQNSITVLQNIQTQSQGAIQVDLTPVVDALIDATPEMENIDSIITSIDEKSKQDVSYLERGQVPEIKIRDAHQDLVVAANMWYAENQGNYPEEVKQAFEDYVKKHLGYIQSEQEAKAMSQPVMPQGTGMGGLQQQMTGPDTSQVQGMQEGLPEQGSQLAPLSAPQG